METKVSRLVVNLFFFFFLLMVDRVFVSIRLNSFGLDFKLIKREKILNKIVYFLRYFLSISVNNYSNIFIFIKIF